MPHGRSNPNRWLLPASVGVVSLLALLVFWLMQPPGDRVVEPRPTADGEDHSEEPEVTDDESPVDVPLEPGDRVSERRGDVAAPDAVDSELPVAEGGEEEPVEIAELEPAGATERRLADLLEAASRVLVAEVGSSESAQREAAEAMERVSLAWVPSAEPARGSRLERYQGVWASSAGLGVIGAEVRRVCLERLDEVRPAFLVQVTVNHLRDHSVPAIADELVRTIGRAAARLNAAGQIELARQAERLLARYTHREGSSREWDSSFALAAIEFPRVEAFATAIGGVDLGPRVYSLRTRPDSLIREFAKYCRADEDGSHAELVAAMYIEIRSGWFLWATQGGGEGDLLAALRDWLDRHDIDLGELERRVVDRAIANGDELAAAMVFVRSHEPGPIDQFLESAEELVSEWEERLAAHDLTLSFSGASVLGSVLGGKALLTSYGGAPTPAEAAALIDRCAREIGTADSTMIAFYSGVAGALLLSTNHAAEADRSQVIAAYGRFLIAMMQRLDALDAESHLQLGSAMGLMVSARNEAFVDLLEDRRLSAMSAEMQRACLIGAIRAVFERYERFEQFGTEVPAEFQAEAHRLVEWALPRAARARDPQLSERTVRLLATMSAGAVNGGTLLSLWATHERDLDMSTAGPILEELRRTAAASGR